MEIERVTILGAGTMGAGIAGQAALCGMASTLFDINNDQLDNGFSAIEKSYSKGVLKQKLSAKDTDLALGRLSRSTDLQSAVSGASLVIEAVPEQLKLKQNLFTEIETYVGSETILASNTSSLSITSIASVLSRPEKCIGLHFFNPVAVMKLLEIVRGDATSDKTIDRAIAFSKRMRKEQIIVRDSPGFATSRLGICLGNEAMRMFEEGVASAEDIDKAMSLGYRHPIGPLALSDLVGLDVRLAITKHLYKELGTETFKPAPILEKMVREGHLGRKTGRGFYTY